LYRPGGGLCGTGVERRGEVPAPERPTCSGWAGSHLSPSSPLFADPVLYRLCAGHKRRCPPGPHGPITRGGGLRANWLMVKHHHSRVLSASQFDLRMSGARPNASSQHQRQRRSLVAQPRPPSLLRLSSLWRRTIHQSGPAGGHPGPESERGREAPRPRSTPLSAGGRSCPSYRLNRYRESQSGRAVDLLRGADPGRR
jgi:hypothetical protein